MKQARLARITLPLVTLCLLLTTPANADERPNIILLMGDDHGWDETGYNGHPHVKTPILDEMSRTGLKLDRFYSAHPTCSPTRGSVMTGRHPNRYGTFTPNYSIRPEEITIAQLLSEAGYRCGHFGKWHLGPVKATSPTSPGAMGFHEWLSHDNFFELDPPLSRNGGPPTVHKGESSAVIIEETTRFAQKAIADDKPFFAVVWFGSPHEPYSGLPNDLALYDDLPEEYAEQTFRLTSNETGKPVERSLRDVLQERYAEITAMDRSIGQLRNWLGEHNVQQSTLLWYCGDNGTPGDGIVTSPFRGKKGNVYDGGIRVPCVMEWPGKIKKQTSRMNTVTSDTLPTLCDLAGITLPTRPLDGISLKPLIAGQPQQRSEPICFWQFAIKTEARNKPWIEAERQTGTTPLVKMMGDIHTRNFRNFHHPTISQADYNGARALLSDNHKLVISGKNAVELFAIDDEGEKHNLADSNPEIASQLQKQLRNWQTSVLNSLTGSDYRQNAQR